MRRAGPGCMLPTMASNAPSGREPAAPVQALHGFTAFVRRGNVVDLAIGVMIGAAFGKIVTSLVTDVITPPLGMLLGKVKFSELKVHLGGPPEAPVTINYGNFVQALLDFLLVALVLFFVISLVNRLHRKPAADAAPSPEQKLLTEIRDELRQRSRPLPPPPPG